MLEAEPSETLGIGEDDTAILNIRYRAINLVGSPHVHLKPYNVNTTLLKKTYCYTQLFRLRSENRGTLRALRHHTTKKLMAPMSIAGFVCKDNSNPSTFGFCIVNMPRYRFKVLSESRNILSAYLTQRLLGFHAVRLDQRIDWNDPTTVRRGKIGFHN